MAKSKTIDMVKSQVIYKDYSKDAERTALVSGENLSHAFGKIARWYTDISWVGHTHTVANITDFPLLGTAASKNVPASGDAGNNEVVMGNDSRLTDARTPTSHTHTESDISDLGTYAGGATKGGPATSANKLNIGSTDIGSETKPVYFSAATGKPVACVYSLNASVPANAVFTDINVKQSPSTANESREVLFAGNTGNTETTGTVGKSNKLYFNPSTGALTATSFSGSINASNLTGTIDAGRLPTTSVTAGSYGPAAGGTLAHGGTFDAAYVTVDKYGRLTAASTKTFTLPAQYVHPSYTSKASGLYKITVDELGHVSGATAATASDLPSHTHPYIPLSGSTAITGELRVTMGETAMPTISVNNGTYRIGIHVGSGGVNHGIYDFSTGINTWMCYHNGTEFLFNGKANTAGKWATARTLTIGSTGKSVDGSGNVSWSLSEIGAAPTSHTHQYAKSSSINGPAYSVEGWEGTDAIYRHVWFSTSSDETRRAYNDNFMYSPTQGTLKFTGWIPVDLTSKTADLNTYNDSTGVYRYRRYICTTTGGGSNISNKAVDAPFVLEVILIRWASTTDYITKQIYHGFDKKTYQRYCTNGTWSAWTEQKYTDTVYTHPTYTQKSSGLYKITVDNLGHVSGTDAVAASDLPAHTHSQYLPLTGGTMTGAITFQVADAIKYNASSTTTNMISFITGASDGHGVRIGGGGLVVIGSGESSTALISALSLTGNTEQTYIASDNNITFYSKCQTIADRLGIVYDNTGRLRPDTDNTRTLGGTDFYWNKAYITQTIGGYRGTWISSRDNATIKNTSVSSSSYTPVVSCKSTSGEWSMGTLGTSEHLYISYTTDTNYSAGTNSAKTWYFTADGLYSGTAASANKWTTARTLTLTGSVTGSASIDGSGNVSLATTTNHTHSQYLPLAGGTMTGILNLWGGRYDDNYALNCNNSTIIGANAIKFADLSDSAGEGIMFYRSATTWDSVWAKNGVLYFTPNHPTDTTNNVVYHSGNLSISRSLTSGTKIATITLNGTATDLYCQTNTNTDTLVTQTNTTADGQYRVVLSGTNDDTTRTETARKSVNLRFNPGTSRLFLRGTTTGDTAYGSTNPAIRFENSNASQNIELLFTDFDAIVNPASLVLIGNQGNESFLAPNIRAWDYTNNKQTAALSCQTVGTTSTVGVGRVALGNSIASGTAGNAKGSVLIYGTNSYYVNLQTTTLTGSREINLPDIGGTMTGIIYKATDYYATADHTHSYIPLAGSKDVTGEIATTSANGYRLVYNKYGAIIRNDGQYWWFLITAKQETDDAAKTASWADTSGLVNNAHPLRIALSDGRVTINGYTINKSVPSTAVFTDTTYTIATGDSNGQIKVTPSSGSAYNVSIKGLGSAAYTASTAYAAASHTHSYLPLAGGTMTGDINFTAVSSTEYPAKSKQIYFSGSTDWAKIYYQVDASDAGRLVFDIGDDTNTRIVFANSGTAKSYIDANGNFSGNAATATTATTTASTNITIQTGSSKLSHITLETLITWLITTKGYVSKTKNNYTVLQTTWAYADNDILQVSINSTNYEIQLAGVVMEFWGCPTGYNSGLWRMRIHTPPTTSYTPASGYTNIGASRVVEYTCNGSGYSPVWRLIEIAGHTHSYAGSSSAGGSATRAVNSDNCKVTVSDPSSAVNYGILFVADPNTTEDNMLRKSNNFRVKHFVGAANTEGKTELIIGNAVAKTAANNCSGFIYLYNSNGKNACIKPNTNSSDITLTLPSSTGTLALVGDNNHTHSYLPLSGGTMTGAITFQVADAIKYNASSATYSMISFITGTADGHGIRIGGGGAVVIGSGESSTNLVSNLSITGQGETTYVSSDNNIEFYSGCQTIANKKRVTIDSNGHIIIGNGQRILQNQNDTSNYSSAIRWCKNNTDPGNYGPEIGQHNIGDTDGSICILPYHTTTSPWGGNVGLFISKTNLKYNGTSVSLSGHTHSYAGSSSAGGAATSANKLNTNAGTATNPVYFSGGVPVACTYSLQRTVLPNYSVTSSNTTNYPYHLLCSMKDTAAGYKDYWAVFRVTPGYHGQYSGVYKVTVRMNNGSASAVSVSLLSGYPYLNDVTKVVAGYNTSGTNTYLYVFLVCPTYARTTVSLLQNGNFTFYSSNEVADTTTSDKKTSVNVYASLAAAGTALVGGSFASTKTSVDVTNYANIVIPTSYNEYDPSSSSTNIHPVLFAAAGTVGLAKFSVGVELSSGLTYDTIHDELSSIKIKTNRLVFKQPSTSSYTMDIAPTTLTANRTITLPDVGGTVTNVIYKTTKTASGATHTGWTNATTDDKIVPTMTFMAYWNGAYNASNNSNLTYCNRGAFGTIVTKGTGDYVANTSDGMSTGINKLGTGTSTPTDADYYVAQYAGGGTTTTSYHRRTHSALFSYIKGKLYKILWSGSTSCTARSTTSITLTTTVAANTYRSIRVVWNCGNFTGISEFRGDTLNTTNNVPTGSDATTVNIIQFKLSSDGKTINVGPGTAAITLIQVAGVYPI